MFPQSLGQSEPDMFRPFQMRDKMNTSKVTETSRVVQTSTLRTEESGTARTSTRYETSTSSIENGVFACNIINVLIYTTVTAVDA